MATTSDWVARCGAIAALLLVLTTALAEAMTASLACDVVPDACTEEEEAAYDAAVEQIQGQVDAVMVRYRSSGCVTTGTRG